MKDYKKRLSIILSLIFSLNVCNPITKGFGDDLSVLDLTSNNERSLDLDESNKFKCLDLNFDEDDDDDDDENIIKSKKNISKVNKNNDKLTTDKNIQIHNVINVMVDGAFSPTKSFQERLKNNLHEAVDSFTSPSSLCCWLASIIATRYLSNTVNVIVFDPNLKKDVLKDAEFSTRDNSNWDFYYKELKKIYSGLGWIDPRENGIKTRTVLTSYNYLDYTSYLALSKILQKDINEMSYKRIMDDKNATNWVYTLAWNHILKTLGFVTKIYKVKSDEVFFNQEYVIVFAKELGGIVKINLLTPFLAKRTNEVDKLFSEPVPKDILENSGASANFDLVNVEDNSDTITLTADKKVEEYFSYNKDTRVLSRKH